VVVSRTIEEHTAVLGPQTTILPGTPFGFSDYIVQERIHLFGDSRRRILRAAVRHRSRRNNQSLEPYLLEGSSCLPRLLCFIFPLGLAFVVDLGGNDVIPYMTKLVTTLLPMQGTIWRMVTTIYERSWCSNSITGRSIPVYYEKKILTIMSLRSMVHGAGGNERLHISSLSMLEKGRSTVRHWLVRVSFSMY